MTAGTSVSGDDDKHLETYTTIPIGLAERVVRKAARFEGTTQFRGWMRSESSLCHRHSAWICACAC